MRIAVRYYTRSGNTEKVAKAIAKQVVADTMKKTLAKVTDELGISVSEKEFHCRGSFGPAHKGRPNEDDLQKAREFAKDVVG